MLNSLRTSGATVPLKLRSRTVSMAFGTISFFMADEDRTVRVDIHRDVLAAIGPPPKTKADYVERLWQRRRQFEQIAALKYEDGEYREEVSVLVVNITQSDIA